MKRRIIIYFIICMSLSSCFPTRQLALTDLSKEMVQLPFKIDNLSIVDKRDSLLSMNWDVPMISAKTKEWKGNPELSETNKNDIEQIIIKSGKQDGIPVNIEFSVLEGLCQLNADWKSVKEYAKFRGEMKLEIPSRNYTYTSYAEMYYNNPTLNGTEKGTMKLYNQAVKNVTHMTLKQIKEEIDKQKRTTNQ